VPMTGSADVNSPAPSGFVVPSRDEIVKVSLERLGFEPCRWQVDVCCAILSCKAVHESFCESVKNDKELIFTLL
jgi:hypothetical protein